jgi:hypothetical protein
MTTAPLTGQALRVGYQFSTGASGNADTVDGIHASATPTANTLLSLDSNARFDQAALPLGAVVQEAITLNVTKQTGTTLIPIDDTIPQITEGDEYMNVTITPKSTTNKLRIEAVANVSSGAASNAIVIALFQDSTANALNAGWQRTQTNDGPMQLTLRHEMAAGTTSATTFRIRIGAQSAGTVTFNGVAATRYFGGVMTSSISITEYKA